MSSNSNYQGYVRIKGTDDESTQKRHFVTALLKIVEHTYYNNGGLEDKYMNHCLQFITAMGNLMKNKSAHECFKPVKISYFDKGAGNCGIKMYYLGCTTTILY